MDKKFTNWHYSLTYQHFRISVKERLMSYEYRLYNNDKYDCSTEYMINKETKYEVSSYIERYINDINRIRGKECTEETKCLIYKHLDNIVIYALDLNKAKMLILYMYVIFENLSSKKIKSRGKIMMILRRFEKMKRNISLEDNKTYMDSLFRARNIMKKVMDIILNNQQIEECMRDFIYEVCRCDYTMTEKEIMYTVRH